MDIIELGSSGEPIRLIDVKFPNDSIERNRLKDYERMAEKLDGNYKTFFVEKCSDWPKKCPNNKKETEVISAPAPEYEKKNSTASYFALGGLVILGVAASICPFDGPVGDIVVWSAVSAQTASMSF